jgi:hypothetical protein
VHEDDLAVRRKPRIGLDAASPALERSAERGHRVLEFVGSGASVRERDRRRRHGRSPSGLPLDHGAC